MKHGTLSFLELRLNIYIVSFICYLWVVTNFSRHFQHIKLNMNEVYKG